MRMLERSFQVQTRYGGGFVESIDGHTGRLGAARLVLLRQRHPGASGCGRPPPSIRATGSGGTSTTGRATDSVPAVVGSFPEPFVEASAGKRLPDDARMRAPTWRRRASRSSAALDAVRVPVASQLLGTGSGHDTLGVLVGTWNDINGDARRQPDRARTRGQRRVRALRRAGGRSLELLDPAGDVARTLGGGAGLIAATAQGTTTPTWLVTGTDAAGVAAAAAALTPARLRRPLRGRRRWSDRSTVPLEAGS